MEQVDITIKRTYRFERIQQLAHLIWPICYKPILSIEQIEYMLSTMYSIEQLSSSASKGHVFYEVHFKNETIGFYSIQNHFPQKEFVRLHKFYLHPKYQGKGLGRLMMNKIMADAKFKGIKGIHLNVNRFNTAYEMYKHLGFHTISQVDIEIGNGFLMEDYVMLLTF